jgi:hypothetical protein
MSGATNVISIPQLRGDLDGEVRVLTQAGCVVVGRQVGGEDLMPAPA